MRNVLAVIIGAAVAYCAMLVTIAGFAILAVRIGPLGASKVTLIVQMYVEAIVLFFIVCVPAGIVAALIASPPWRRRCTVLTSIVIWLVYLILGRVFSQFFAAAEFVPLTIGFVALTIGNLIAYLLGALTGGLVGAILYEKVRAKFVRKER